MRAPEHVKIYTIPNNYVDEGRILNGLFRTRYFLEGCVLSVIGLVIAFLIPAQSLTTRISLIVLCCAPFFMLGLMGLNGDPVSVSLVYIIHWARNRTPVLYDRKVRVLVGSPLDKMMREKPAKDVILEKIEAYRQQNIERTVGRDFVEGENFVFAKDKDSFRVYKSPNEDVDNIDYWADPPAYRGDEDDDRLDMESDEEEYADFSFTEDGEEPEEDDRHKPDDPEAPSYGDWELADDDDTVSAAPEGREDPDETDAREIPGSREPEGEWEILMVPDENMPDPVTSPVEGTGRSRIGDK